MQLDPFTLAPMVEKDEPVFSTWKKYDVFLSFRGTDTRRKFVSHLYHELKTVRGIETFKDDREIEIGEHIDGTLLQAIEESHFAIVVLSENYATSAWCLDELTKICEFMGSDNKILPLFYYIKPTVVRHQSENFEKAFEDHKVKGRHSEEKIKQWRNALKKVADFSGISTTEHNCDREVIDHIVESLCKKLQTIKSCPLISLREFELFNATQETMDQVMKALKIENIVYVGVCGKAGIGKTTMVEHIAAKVKKEGLFKYVAMSVISRKPNLWEIQDRLAAMLGMPLTSRSEYERAKSLKLKIKREDSILIILDNICSKIMLSDIGIPSFEELKKSNSKVQLITQEMDVLSEFKCLQQITMSCLSERDSWRLLEKHTGKYFERETKLYKAARKIIQGCAFLPIALKTVAKALTGKSLEQWRATARRLKASHNSHTNGMGDVYECIKVSYDYLDKDHQICFLLCCLFPEGYDIRIEDLLKYRIGKGSFEESDMLAARESICSVVRSLKEKNLLLDSKTDGRCARMHNVIRDVGLSISLSEHGHKQFFVRAGCQLEKWPTIYEHEYYTAFSLVRNKISNLPNDFVFPQLQILLLQSSFGESNQRDIPASLFQSLEALRVLDISQNLISFQPFSSTTLTSLHTLCLDRCLSSHCNMSFLGQLKLLQILSMRHYPDITLPEEIGQLTKLKLLDFTSVSVEIVPCGLMSNLKDLEELYMQCYFADWEGSDMGEMVRTKPCLKDLTDLPLRILSCFISDAASMPRTVKIDPGWKNFDIWIVADKSVRRKPLDSIDQSVRGQHLDSSSLVYSRALTLDISIDTLPKWFVDFVVKKTQKLQYMGCPELSNILSEYGSRRLHKLKYLSVTGPNEKLQEFMSVTRTRNEPVFENLEELHLDQLDGLEKLHAGELPTESLISLRLLTVMRCHKLKTVLESNILQRLQKLEKISCEVMDNLEYVVSSEELEQSTLPELKEMKLESLKKLKRISMGPASCKFFDHVKVLAVIECKELKHLFTYAEAEHLHNLEDLSIEACQRMESVIAASEELVTVVSNKMVLPKLMKLELRRLMKLTRFCGSTGNNTNDEENIEFPSLKHSFVDRCKSFQSPARKTFDSIGKQPR